MTKLLNFVLVFLLSMVNFVIMLAPLSLFVFPFIYFFKLTLIGVGLNVVLLLGGLISGYMLLYLIGDCLFGFTVRNYLKQAIPSDQAGFLNGHEDIVTAFSYLKKRFNLPRAELYISQDMQVNAYAVGSFRKKAVVMTLGLIHRMYNASETKAEYIHAVKGIMGHEMSHLINKDFLPGMLVYSNEVAHRFISRIIRVFFMGMARVVFIIPCLGKPIAHLFITFYRALETLTSMFYRLLFQPVYGFLYKAFSRSIEHRCDKDSARVFGGEIVAHALSMLGKGAYFSIFSTHPATKSRVKYVRNIQPESGIIKMRTTSGIANIVAVGGLTLIVLYCFAHTHIGQLQHEIIFPIQHRIQNWWFFLRQ